MTSTASRREFLNRVSAVVTAGVIAPYAFGLTGMAAASAQTATDYKALVCITLGGGNDHLNTFVPYDATSYSRYAAVRGGLAVDRATLGLVNSAIDQGGRQIGFHPAMAGVKTIYDAGRAALIANVGVLHAPTTRADIAAGRAFLPRLLGSHADQGDMWAALNPNQTQGWGGRIADLLAASNGNTAFTTISSNDYPLFAYGLNTTPFSVADWGVPQPFYDYTTPLGAAVTGSRSSTNLIEQAYSDVHDRFLASAGTLGSTLLPESSLPPVNVGSNLLARQLQTMARIIGANQTLGMKRQIFLVQQGGFDTHLGQSDAHPRQLQEVNDALVFFDAALAQLGLSDNVTTFTTAEFGRTYIPNGDGTDHGWGSHHIVMGGAVKGGSIYGSLPTMDLAGPDFFNNDNSSMIPSTAAAQYAATLGKWLGVGSADLAAILPDLGRFNTTDLGFLR
jgi:uncharacterized protein (DUF1501 family)